MIHGTQLILHYNSANYLHDSRKLAKTYRGKDGYKVFHRQYYSVSIGKQYGGLGCIYIQVALHCMDTSRDTLSELIVIIIIIGNFIHVIINFIL